MSISLPSPGSSKIRWVEVNIHNWTDAQFAQRQNYDLLHSIVRDRYDGLTGLFGGGRSGEGSYHQDTREEAVDSSAKFLRCLVGRREPNHMIQLEDMQILWSAMDGLVNPKNLSRTENFNDLREIGVFNGSEFNWSRLKMVGQILRQNRWFRAQAVRNPVAPYLLLRQELAKVDGHEKGPEKEESAV